MRSLRAQYYRCFRASRSCKPNTPRSISTAKEPHSSERSLGATRASSTPKLNGGSTTLADHRELGLQQELFITSKYSPGSPIFLPNGTKIFIKLVEFLRAQYEEFGFQEVISPTIYKRSLWEKSGHWDNYADDMYAVVGRGALGTREGEQEGQNEEYGLKPMNCPGHCLIFASKSHSYRDLPIRYADFSSLHRNEIAGALSGLTRVRRFHQDDGHIFCRPSQIKEEIRRTLEFVKLAYRVLGLGPYRLALSTRPTKAFIGSVEDWENAESALTETLNASGLEWTIKEGDGAFYGPKIDIILTDTNGKEHQTATIQLDFQLPKRFDLQYQAPAPEMEQRGLICMDPALLKAEGPVTPVLIHRAVLGSVERIMALLIEHHNGHWPFWMNPRQVVIITLNDSQEILDYAVQIKRTLQGLGSPNSSEAKRQAERGVESDLVAISVCIFDKPVGIRHKIAVAKSQRYAVILLVGPKEVKSQTISADFSGIPIRNHFTKDILRAVVKTSDMATPHCGTQFDYGDALPSEALNRVIISATQLRSTLLELQRLYS